MSESQQNMLTINNHTRLRIEIPTNKRKNTHRSAIQHIHVVVVCNA